MECPENTNSIISNPFFLNHETPKNQYLNAAMVMRSHKESRGPAGQTGTDRERPRHRNYEKHSVTTLSRLCLIISATGGIFGEKPLPLGLLVMTSLSPATDGKKTKPIFLVILYKFALRREIG